MFFNFTALILKEKYLFDYFLGNNTKYTNCYFSDNHGHMHIIEMP